MEIVVKLIHLVFINWFDSMTVKAIFKVETG